MNIPDWLSAGVGVLALTGGLSGMYATMKSHDNLALYRIDELAVRVARSEDYDGVLTEDMNKFDLRLTKQESTMEYLAVGQSKLANEIGQLTKAVLKMNETLIKQGVENGER